MCKGVRNMAVTADSIKTLHPLEIRVLRTYKPGDHLTASLLCSDLGFVEGQANQVYAWLTAKQLACDIERKVYNVYELTDLGKSWLEKGTPEQRMITYLENHGPEFIPAICTALGLEQKDIGSAFGRLSKDGAVGMTEEKRVKLIDKQKDTLSLAIQAVLTRVQKAGGSIKEFELSKEEQATAGSIAKKRGAGDSPLKLVERETITWTLSDAVLAIQEELKSMPEQEEIGALTQDILTNGTWKNARFRPYTITNRTSRVISGRHNSYVQFLESVKDKLVSLGFEEFDGSLVETEFWNGDALFMPQFHSARDIHDVYYVAEPTHADTIEEPYFSRVAQTHENGGSTGSRGWGYTFDRAFSRRLILRSQGTVLSAHQLPHAKVPGKYFGIVRCFRYDKVDATHLSDFYQTEGIVLGEHVSLRTLLGFLEMFAVEIAGAKDVKYVPGYFPFTEPSIEVHIKHPVLGWFELGGAGIFRPEVTESLGVRVPVLAWGIGIDRMALMALGLNDLRELFSYDIENVRLRRTVMRGNHA